MRKDEINSAYVVRKKVILIVGFEARTISLILSNKKIMIENLNMENHESLTELGIFIKLSIKSST